MELILKDIQEKLKNEMYKNEEMVRSSIVVRILDSLGWDIWNPSEVYYEYPVKKFPQNLKKDENGRVDIALFISNRSDRTPEVFIETKAIDKLKGNYADYEEQLQRYNYYDKSAISVLTDGVIWKFYLPSAYGTFSQRLFNEINLKEDDISFITSVLKQVLFKENFRKTAVQAGLDMLEELKIISEIAPVKHEAELMAIKLKKFTKYELASQLLEDKYSTDTIKKYWDGKNRFEVEQIDEPLAKNEEMVTKSVDLKNFDPRGKKPNKVFIIDQWYEINSWRKLYIKVCEEIIKRFPDTTLNNYLSDDNRWSKNTDVIRLDNGKFLNVNWNSVNCVKYSIRFLENHGLEINKHFKIKEDI